MYFAVYNTQFCVEDWRDLDAMEEYVDCEIEIAILEEWDL